MIRLFGTTIEETITGIKSELHLGPGQSAVSTEDKIKLWGRLIISIVLLAFAFFNVAEGKTDIGGTIIGAVTGYWLK